MEIDDGFVVDSLADIGLLPNEKDKKRKRKEKDQERYRQKKAKVSQDLATCGCDKTFEKDLTSLDETDL